MAEDQRLGALHWIDHYAVPTSDIERWIEWNANVLGAVEPWGDTEPAPGETRVGAFRHVAGAHVAAFQTKNPIPASNGLGKSYPRYGLYIRPEDIDEHLRRLDRFEVTHSDPIRTSAEGEPGTAIYFQDFDENQLEFWAPDRMPEGALDGCGPLRVGRLSHAIFESRDLDRTAAFFSRYCGLDAMSGGDIAEDTLVMPLVAGARLIYKKVDTLGVRTGGSTRWRGVHSAFIVREDEFIPAYERVWAELEEWDYDQAAQGPLKTDPGDLPARTGMHGSAAGRHWKAMYGRGDQIYDWDTNSFHFVGGSSSHPQLATYEAHYMEEYVDAFMKNKEANAR
jgi:catechol 2,3-dioxygenase-like lactoylglutathione lyase family enzyme